MTALPRRLLAWQAAALALCAVVVVVGLVPVWGAWLPALAMGLGAAVHARFDADPVDLADRAWLKDRSWRAGRAWGVVAGATLAVAALGGSFGEVGLLRGLGLGLVGGGGAALVTTGLSLIGLDAGRTGRVAS